VSADEDELLARSREWDRAVQDRDGELAAAILSDGYELVLVQPAPSRMPRARWLEVLPEYVVHDWDVEEQLVDISGDTAAVLQRVRMDATVRRLGHLAPRGRLLAGLASTLDPAHGRRDLLT
jgi:hypothetical protein